MDKNQCKMCGLNFDDDITFHKHLRTHRFTQTEYYQKYFPRYDRFDGKIILYKNKEYYFSTEFNSKENFKKWLSATSLEEQRKYIVEFLTKRKERKGLIWALTQVELKTLMLPGVKYINENLGGYEEICKLVGLRIRFSNDTLNEKSFKNIEKKVIFADTREQKPLDFVDNTVRKEGLNFGDYRMAGSKICIERKSISDIWGTLMGGRERFERELKRAFNSENYLIVLIEGPFSELEKFPTLSRVHGKIKIPVECIYHSIRELSQKYQHIQFLFVRDRNEASRIVVKLFSVDEQVKNVDLQLLYDKGQL